MVKAKRKADGEIIDVSSVEYTNIRTNVKSRYCSKDGKMYPLSDLDFLPEKETAVMEGWVARDNFGVFLFEGEPTRDEWLEEWKAPARFLKLPTDSFPSVTWQSEPKKVRIELTLIDE
ncbi:MAG: hypothetical protein O2U62_00095 [Candidatus Bathyarchaeota archaeon]|nr:hypothetical protein [Candidatus Bathyarchaeota archaeon]